MLNKALLTLLLASCTVSLTAQEAIPLFDKLKDLKLLRSTRADVVRILGTPSGSSSEYLPKYRLAEGAVSVEYSRGLCASVKNGGWDVAAFTLTRIFFEPSKPLTPKQLGFHLSSFIKNEIDDVPGAFSYENERMGINFTLKRSGHVESIEIYPTPEHDELACKGPQY